MADNSVTFMQLCNVFEKVRASKLKREKIQILQEFIDKCRNDASKVESAHENKLVCTLLSITLC